MAPHMECREEKLIKYLMKLLILLKSMNLLTPLLSDILSGMYVRLAFSVAAHLKPEILIVDEVLAVGDADFQGRCLRKMKRYPVKEEL